jgi:hypothetical protein
MSSIADGWNCPGCGALNAPAQPRKPQICEGCRAFSAFIPPETIVTFSTPEVVFVLGKGPCVRVTTAGTGPENFQTTWATMAPEKPRLPPRQLVYHTSVQIVYS